MDVHVVGAGPSGSIAAISAARNGHSVVLSEDHHQAGIPENCSGLFSKDGLESLSQFFDYHKPGLIKNEIRGADIYLAGEKLSVRRKAPVAFVCDRAGIDQELASTAEQEGAHIHYGERISGKFHSNNIIGADGPLSPTALHFSFPKIPKFVSTLQSVVPYHCEDKHAVELFFSNQQFPGFFGWVIPHDEEYAEFGVGAVLPYNAVNSWQCLFKLKGMSASSLSSIKPRGAVIPIRVRKQTAKVIGGPQKTNVLLVGDAAGQVKATTGGGVIFGGNCAAIAGANVLAPARYESEWRSKFALDLKMHHVLQGYLESLDDRAMQSLAKRLNKMNLGAFLSENGHMDKPTKMVGFGLFEHGLRNLPSLFL